MGRRKWWVLLTIALGVACVAAVVSLATASPEHWGLKAWEPGVHLDVTVANQTTWVLRDLLIVGQTASVAVPPLRPGERQTVSVDDPAMGLRLTASYWETEAFAGSVIPGDSGVSGSMTLNVYPGASAAPVMVAVIESVSHHPDGPRYQTGDIPDVHLGVRRRMR